MANFTKINTLSNHVLRALPEFKLLNSKKILSGSIYTHNRGIYYSNDYSAYDKPYMHSINFSKYFFIKPNTYRFQISLYLNHNNDIYYEQYIEQEKDLISLKLLLNNKPIDYHHLEQDLFDTIREIKIIKI